MGSRLKRSEIKYEVTETGVDSCKINIAFAILGKFNIIEMNIGIKRHTNVRYPMMINPWDKFIGRNLATETPNVINITGIAICPVSSRDLVKKIGV